MTDRTEPSQTRASAGPPLAPGADDWAPLPHSPRVLHRDLADRIRRQARSIQIISLVSAALASIGLAALQIAFRDVSPLAHYAWCAFIGTPVILAVTILMVKREVRRMGSGWRAGAPDDLAETLAALQEDPNPAVHRLAAKLANRLHDPPTEAVPSAGSADGSGHEVTGAR